MVELRFKIKDFMFDAKQSCFGLVLDFLGFLR